MPAPDLTPSGDTPGQSPIDGATAVTQNTPSQDTPSSPPTAETQTDPDSPAAETQTHPDSPAAETQTDLPTDAEDAAPPDRAPTTNPQLTDAPEAPPHLPLWARPAEPALATGVADEWESSNPPDPGETGDREPAEGVASTSADPKSAESTAPTDAADEPTAPGDESAGDTPSDTKADSPSADAESTEAAPDASDDAPTQPAAHDAPATTSPDSASEPGDNAVPPATPRSDRSWTPAFWKRRSGPTTSPPTGPATGKRRRTAIITLVSVLVVVLVGAPAWGISYFSTRAKPGVTVLGQAVTGQTRAELTTTLTSLGDSLSLPLTDGSTTIQARGADVGVTLDVPQSVTDALAESGPHSPWTTYAPWQRKPAPVALLIDQAKLQESLDRAFVPEGEAAVEASVAYDTNLGQFVAQPSRTGLRTRLDPVIQQLRANAARGIFAHVEVTTETDVPAFTNEAAQQAADLANARLGLALTLTNGQTGWAERSYQVPAANLASWAVITPNADTGQFDLSWDEAKMTTDLMPVLSTEIGTPMKPTVTVMDPRSPDEVLGYEWGQDGTKVADPPGAVAAVRQALIQGQSLTFAVPLVPDPATETQQLPPTNFDEPHGAKWIDVNKTTYLATAYEGTTEVNQFVISIGRGGVYETSDGTYYIYLKYDYQVMRGGTGRVEGRYEYATPVTWVSYFNADQAFHQADWNTWQGTWQERVSHGCVNMHGEDAQWIFNWAPIGTKVVVHY